MIRNIIIALLFLCLYINYSLGDDVISLNDNKQTTSAITASLRLPNIKIIEWDNKVLSDLTPLSQLDGRVRDELKNKLNSTAGVLSVVIQYLRNCKYDDGQSKQYTDKLFYDLYYSPRDSRVKKITDVFPQSRIYPILHVVECDSLTDILSTKIISKYAILVYLVIPEYPDGIWVLCVLSNESRLTGTTVNRYNIDRTAKKNEQFIYFIEPKDSIKLYKKKPTKSEIVQFLKDSEIGTFSIVLQREILSLIIYKEFEYLLSSIRHGLNKNERERPIIIDIYYGSSGNCVPNSF